VEKGKGHYSVTFIHRFRIFVTAAVCSGCTFDTARKPSEGGSQEASSICAERIREMRNELNNGSFGFEGW
jgi:hypothetical protein